MASYHGLSLLGTCKLAEKVVSDLFYHVFLKAKKALLLGIPKSPFYTDTTYYQSYLGPEHDFHLMGFTVCHLLSSRPSFLWSVVICRYLWKSEKAL